MGFPNAVGMRLGIAEIVLARASLGQSYFSKCLAGKYPGRIKRSPFENSESVVSQHGITSQFAYSLPCYDGALGRRAECRNYLQFTVHHAVARPTPELSSARLVELRCRLQTLLPPRRRLLHEPRNRRAVPHRGRPPRAARSAKGAFFPERCWEAAIASSPCSDEAGWAKFIALTT